MNILFVTSEAHPLIKTGGLADVAGSLPNALKKKRHDARILIPAYHDILQKQDDLKQVATLSVIGCLHPIHILEGKLPGTQVKVWFVDYPPAFNRPGNPYLTLQGDPWPDNAQRFALLSRVAVEIAQNRAGLDWQAEIVHCNDWQSALTPALLSLEASRPATIFTIHNLSYQGLYPQSTFDELMLPKELWHPYGLEYYDQFSMIKGGLCYADIITTVSPTYAKEIQTYEYGYGLEGLLRHRKDRLHGILNGVDYNDWSPSKDTHLLHNYNSRTLSEKAKNKKAMQRHFKLPQKKSTPMIGIVARLIEQKGIDLVLGALPHLIHRDMQLVVLGSGNSQFEKQLQQWASWHPDKIAVQLGYDETLAHRIEGSADIFLMPSRFEPCGLNQMYSLKYGTIPIVRRVGGLADSVVDATPENLENKTATGFVFDHADSNAVCWAIEQAFNLYQDEKGWKQLCLNGMKQNFDWKVSAERYLEIYQKAITLKG